MTNKPSKPINLFDVQASQKIIGQEKFLNAFQTILNHGGIERPCLGRGIPRLHHRKSGI